MQSPISGWKPEKPGTSSIGVVEFESGSSWSKNPCPPCSCLFPIFGTGTQELYANGPAEKFDCEFNEVMDVEKEEPKATVSGITGRFQKIRDHWNSYPYVWASYVVVFGGLGIYSAYRWRALRKVEDEVLKFQEKVKLTMTAEELEQAIKDSQAGKS